MKVLVIYDSAYGNTERVAQAMGQALSEQAEVEVKRVTEAETTQLAGLDLLIVGSPTQRFQMLSSVKSFLDSIPAQGLTGVRVAAFDTRIALEDMDPGFARSVLNFFIRLFGYAAKPIAERLEKKGGEPVLPPEGFFVEGTEGPLKEGELERAAAWARQAAAV